MEAIILSGSTKFIGYLTPEIISIKLKYALIKYKQLKSELTAKLKMPVVPKSELKELLANFNKQLKIIETYEKYLKKIS